MYCDIVRRNKNNLCFDFVSNPFNNISYKYSLILYTVGTTKRNGPQWLLFIFRFFFLFLPSFFCFFYYYYYLYRCILLQARIAKIFALHLHIAVSFLFVKVAMRCLSILIRSFNTVFMLSGLPLFLPLLFYVLLFFFFFRNFVHHKLRSFHCPYYFPVAIIKF